MKRFWLVLLSLGLIMAFSVSAYAVDVKFSGSFYAAGMYLDKTTLTNGTATDGPSTAFYFQRLRISTDFVVSPGLSLITRFDVMERAWGAVRFSATGTVPGTTSTADIYSAGTRAENENIAFDYTYVKYLSPIGIFQVGIMGDGTWGTPFGDYDLPAGKVFYAIQSGPFAAGAYVAKFKDQSNMLILGNTASDRDVDMYCAFGVYNFKSGSAGLLWKMYRNAAVRPYGFTQVEHFLLPYVKAKIGPVSIQSEVIYGFGDYMNQENPTLATPNVKLDNLAAWVDATVDLGMVYFGASVAYVAGDDIGTTDKKEGGVITGGYDWNPCLILFNSDRYYWAGQLPGYDGSVNPNNNDNPYLSTNNGGMTNAWFFQGRVGVKPTDKLDIMAAVSYANADRKPTATWLYNSYGWEADVTATYKITNNLSYMLGAGYLWTGKYFYGQSETMRNLANDYLIINKLTLTF
jgi:hypothetical protein